MFWNLKIPDYGFPRAAGRNRPQRITSGGSIQLVAPGPKPVTWHSEMTA